MQLQTNITLPEDHIKLQALNVKAFIGDNECGKGTLAVAESNLVWKQENSDNGLCFEYPNIALHAISNDSQAFPDPCLYLILDKSVSDEHNDYSSGDDNEESENLNEIRFVPEDKQLLKPLFQAMNDCQALYPDKSMSGDEEDEDDEEEDDDEEGHDEENGHNEEEMEDAVEDENNGSN